MLKEKEKNSRELDAYMLAWGLHRIYETIGGGNQTLGWSMAAQVGIVSMTIASFLIKSSRIWMACMLLIICFDLSLMPFVWDSEYWCMQTDMAMIIAIIACSGDRSKLVPLGRKLICIQMVIFYAAAALWKLNTDFFDTRSSCAPIFVSQMIDLLSLQKVLTNALIRLILKTAPTLVVALEGSIALALAAPAGREFGVKAGLILHILIAVCPPPNNVATFSLMCLSRLCLFVPSGLLSVLSRPPSFEVKLLWLVIIPVSSYLAWHPDFYDLGLPLFMAAAPLLWSAATKDADILRGLEDYEKSHLEYLLPSKPDRFFFKIGRAFILLFALFYSFALLGLGLLDQGAPHMYANLRLHAGSNHFFLPTGLLQKYSQAPATLGGGIVRIEASTSPLLNRYYPSEYTMDLTQGTRDVLHIVNHTGRMWNPMLSLVTSSEAPWDDKTPFIKYTMPAHEFRRMLTFVRAEESQPYFIEYFHLNAASGDEAWRASSTDGRLIRFEHTPAKNQTKCRVLRPKSAKCSSSDLPNLPPLPFWARKLLLFQPYPIVPNDYRLHCFGP